MKKILVRIGIVVVVLLVLAVVTVGLFLDRIVKHGVETVGPKVTGVPVKLDSVKLSIFSGSGTIQGLTVGNPPGFKTTNSISLGSVTLVLQPRSLFADKIVIRKVEIIAPEITFEGGLSGNNIEKIIANVNSGGSADTNAPVKPGESQSGKKLQVDDFLIRGAKVSATLIELPGVTKTVSIPDIHFSNLGAGPEGITTAELVDRVLRVVEREAVKAIGAAFPEFTKGLKQLSRELEKNTGGNLTNITRVLDQSAGGSLTNVTRGLNDLFNKKK